MINWIKTRELFGTTKELVGTRPKVWCICDTCQEKESPITIRVKSDVINGQLKWDCASCVGKRKDVSQKLSKSTKKQWQTKEYKIKMRELKERQKTSKNFSDSIKKKARQERLKKNHAWSNPLNIEKASIKSKKLLKNPIIKERQKDGLKKAKPRLNINTNRSSLEKIFKNILDDANIQHIHQYVHGPWSFDFLIENTLIEINGEYWHSLKKQQIRDKQKRSYVSNNTTYDYMIINEHEFLSPEKILSKINKIKPIKILNIDTKDLSIREISNQKASLFLKQYHYLGAETRSGYYIGLFYNTKLIGVAGFGSVIRNQILKKHHNVIELIRFCLSPIYKNKNMGSWFLSRSIKLAHQHYNNDVFITYADTTVGHTGALYKATNWKYDGETKSSYWYLDQHGNKYHKKTIWDHAKRMSMTEHDYSKKHNLVKIKDKPKKRFIYKVR